MLELVRVVLGLLGQGVLHSDQYVSVACAVGLETALSARPHDSLTEKIADVLPKVLVNLTEMVNRFGNGDHHDATRVSGLARACGTVLSSTTPLGPDANLTSARDGCVECLFGLLGSDSYKKENEVALTCGEALATYADCTRVKGSGAAAAELRGLDEAFDPNYAATLPFYKYVIYRALTKEFQAHNPQTRTATVSVIFALVVRASEVSLVGRENTFAETVTVLLPALQAVFVKSLSDPKSKQLSRECSCRGLAACFGLSKAAGEVGESDALNESLLKAFGQTTNHGGSAMMETREQEALRRIQNAETQAEGREALNTFLEQGECARGLKVDGRCEYNGI